jgi:hypothetical protein
MKSRYLGCKLAIAMSEKQLKEFLESLERVRQAKGAA